MIDQGKYMFVKQIMEYEKLHGPWCGIVVSERDWIKKEDMGNLTFEIAPEQGDCPNGFKRVLAKQVDLYYIPDTLIPKKRYIGDMIFADELNARPPL